MPISILSIDPGSRYWGISVFHGRTLIASFSKSLSTKGTPRNRVSQARKLFLSLCRKHAPHVLVLEKPYDFWEDQSEYLRRIIGEIKRLAMKERVKVIEFSAKSIRKLICQDERATREKIAEAIARSCPELKDYLTVGRKYNNNYWARIMNSMAIGVCFLEKRTAKPKKVLLNKKTLNT